MKASHTFPLALVLLSSFFIPQAQAAGTCGSSADGVGTTHCTGSNPWTADSVSYEDVNQCVNTCATYEDTVNVPAGTANWGDKRLTITKGIKLLGAGKDKTIINSTQPSYTFNSYLIVFEADATTAANDYQFKLSGFTLQANGAYAPYALLYLSNDGNPTKPLTKVIITNNKFKQLVTSDSSVSIIVKMAIFGVIYNNEIIDGTHALRPMGNIGTGKKVEYWEPGSKYAMYFEDNQLGISTEWGTSLIISGGNGNRIVVRYNTWTLMNDPNKYSQAVDIHGNQGNNNGAGIGYEVYGNKRIGMAGQWFAHRGGRLTFFYNQWTNTAGSGYYSVFEEYNDDTYIATSCVGYQYPQTASGNCVQAPREGYYWRNFVGTDGTKLVTTITHPYDHFNIGTGQVNDPLTLFENQDWWRDNNAAFTGAIDPIGSCGYYGGPACTKSGTGCGTLASRPATCTTGVAYWATDQSCSDLTGMVGAHPSTPISGTLYKCTSTNTWTLYYTPYKYPHPLRMEPQQTCSDGTPYSSCSSTKPLYCSSGTLISNCQTCGCPSDQSCQTDGSCQSTSQTCSSQGYYCCPSGYSCSQPASGTGCAGTCCASQSYCTQLPAGLVLQLHLDEGSGSTAQDSSGNGNNGIITGGTYTTDRRLGTYALRLDGTSGYIRIPDSQSMDFDKSQGTIEMWVKPENPARGSYQLLVLDSGWNIELDIMGNGDLFYYPNFNDTWRNYNLVTNPLVPGKWNHVAVTWEFPTKKTRIYVNGSEKALAIENVPTYWLTPAYTADWHIGGSTAAAGRYINGTIDEIRVYNTVLSAADIAAHAREGCHKSDSDCSDCVSGTELSAFISLWYLDSSNPTLKELMEAIGLWKRGC